MVSVTTILEYFTEPELLAWMLREGQAKCQKISQEALRVGTIVDQCVKADLKGQAMSYDSKDKPVVNCVMAWQRFKEDHPLFVSTVTGIQTEIRYGEIVGHPDLEVSERQPLKLGERPDLLANPKVIRHGIIDIKTSKSIQPKHWTQVAAYLILRNEAGMRSPLPLFMGILRLDKLTGKYEYKEVGDFSIIRDEFEVFQAYLTAYQHGQKVREMMRQMAEQEAFQWK